MSEMFRTEPRKGARVMQACPNCGRSNSQTESYCYACGHILPVGLPGLANTTMRLEQVYEALPPKRRWGTAYFDYQNRLELVFRDTEDVLSFPVTGEIVIGRGHDEQDIEQPDIDLTPFGAIEKGVSRRHLALIRQHDTIGLVDLGSANSTFLNGQRLIPSERRILRDGDELRLGRLVIRIRFT